MGKRLFVLEVPEQLSPAENARTQQDLLAAIQPHVGDCELFVLDGGWRLKELTRPEPEWEDVPEAPEEGG